METIRSELLDWIKANDSALPLSVSDSDLLDVINSFGYSFESLTAAHEELVKWIGK